MTDEVRRVSPGYEIRRDDGGLTARERQVIGLLHEGKTQISIAEEMGLTRQRVSAIAKSARAKIAAT